MTYVYLEKGYTPQTKEAQGHYKMFSYQSKTTEDIEKLLGERKEKYSLVYTAQTELEGLNFIYTILERKENTTMKKQVYEGHTAKVWIVSSQDYYVGPKGPTFSHVFYSDELDAIHEEAELVGAGHLNVSRKRISASKLSRNIEVDSRNFYHLYKFVTINGKIKYGVTNL